MDATRLSKMFLTSAILLAVFTLAATPVSTGELLTSPSASSTCVDFHHSDLETVYPAQLVGDGSTANCSTTFTSSLSNGGQSFAPVTTEDTFLRNATFALRSASLWNDAGVTTSFRMGRNSYTWVGAGAR